MIKSLLERPLTIKTTQSSRKATDGQTTICLARKRLDGENWKQERIGCRASALESLTVDHSS